MSCGCKDDKANAGVKKEIERITFTDSLFMRIFLFILSLGIVMIALIPIMIPLIFIMLFNRIVLQKNTDVTGVLLKVGKSLKTSKKRKGDSEEDYESIDEINPEDYELSDVDVIR
jgi:hypothetical protein